MLNNLLITTDAAHLIQSFMDEQLERTVNDQERMALEVKASGLRNTLVGLTEHQGLSFEQWWQLLDALAAMFEQPAIGLNIGEQVKVEYFGCLGYLLKTSQDLAQALSCFERFQRLLYDGNQAQLVFERTDEGKASTKLIWQADYGYSNQISDELLLSGIVALVRQMLNDATITPLCVDFTNQVPSELIPLYQEYFGCPVRFGQTNLSISLATEYFMVPILGSDLHLHQLMSSQAEGLLEHAPKAELASSNFTLQVKKKLVRALNEGEPSADVVAKECHISVRTLHRKLSEEGAVFRDVLKDTRMRLAKQHLTNSQLSLPEIALMLGYSEQSAFNRAFKSWFGQTPKQFQKNSS